MLGFFTVESFDLRLTEIVQCDKAMFCEVVRIEENSRKSVSKDIFIVGNYGKKSEFRNASI
jgi:hypothetical protein